MSFINVAEWTPKHVVEWLQGLEDCIIPYVNFFLENQINGCRLLLLNSDDLEKLHIKKIGHQEIILDAIELLKNLHYNFSTETLQNLALKLGCKSRSLYNHIEKEDDCNSCEKCLAKVDSQNNYLSLENENSYSNLFNSNKKQIATFLAKKTCQKITTFTLSCVCDILISVKQFISWIDKYFFERQKNYAILRKTILRISIELASTAQRDHFVENPKEIIRNNCFLFAEICERTIQDINDSLAIQPACLEMVPIKFKEEEELGMQIRSNHFGTHVVGNIKMQSPTHRCGRIEEGDEIIQINYQTVLGWQQKKLIEAMDEYDTKVLITLKKRPRHSNIVGQLKVLKPNKIPDRQMCTKSLLVNSSQKYQETLHSNYQNKYFINSNLEKSVLSDYNLNVSPKEITCTENHENEKCCEKNAIDHKKLIEQISLEKPMKGPVYQMLMKPKKLRRRATISGSSPTTLYPPIKIEDLVNLNNTETYFLNKKKSIKSSNLNLQNEEINQNNNTSLYKSYNNLNSSKKYEDDFDSTVINQKQNIKLRPFTDHSQFKKRTVSVCCNEVYGINDEFFKQNYLALPKKLINKCKNDNIDENSCYIKNDSDNKTIICVNTKKTLLPLDKNLAFNQCINEEDLVTENVLNNFNVLSLENKKVCRIDNNIKQNTYRNNEDYINLKTLNLEKNKLNNSEENSNGNNYRVELENESFSQKNLKIDDKNNFSRQEPEFLKRKKSFNKQTKLTKNLSCNQVKENSDYKGWLSYIRIGLTSDSNETSLGEFIDFNYKLDKNLFSSHKWKENFLILKNDLLYFYSTEEDNQQPSRIINLPTFNLDDCLDYRSGLNFFKIRNQKYAFFFASTDLNLLNNWIIQIKNIIARKKLEDEILTFNTQETYNYFEDKNLRLAQSFRNLSTNNKNDQNYNEVSNKQNLKLINISNKPFVKNENRNTFILPNNGLYLRSQSCLDSNYTKKTKGKILKNFNFNKQYSQENESLEANKEFLFAFPKPPKIEKPQLNYDCKISSPKTKLINLYSDQQVQTEYNVENNSFNNNSSTFKGNNLNNFLNDSSKKPTPQPRISKIKEQNANFVGKIISSFDELSKQCDKDLQHYSSLRKQSNEIKNDRTIIELNKKNTVFNSYPRNSLNKTDENLSTNSSNQKTYVSILDQEYNKLFKKNPPELKSFKQQTPIVDFQVNRSNHTLSKLNGSNSPISDNSLSSSSGISSYYSMGQEFLMERQISNISNEKIDSDSLKNNSTLSSFNFSPNSEKSINSSYETPNNYLEKNNTKNKNHLNSEEKSLKQVQKKSSFRLFGSSSKVLSKFNMNSNDSEEKNVPKSKSFLTSPRLKRSFFSLRKTSNETKNNKLCSTAVQTDENDFNRNKSKSIEYLNTAICSIDNNLLKKKKIKNKPDILVLTNKLLDNTEFPSTPETPRKPTMGISMLSKRRSSSVSADRIAIETALQIHKEKFSNVQSSVTK